MTESEKIITASEIQSKGGKARSSKLSPERRKEIATLASNSRKCIDNLPKIIDSGELLIGNTVISCAVLDDGRRVINETSLYEILGIQRGGRAKGANLPRFLTVSNLKPLISNDLDKGTEIISFKGKKGHKSYGYEATLIPEICKIYLDARELGILNENQLAASRKCEVILHSLAKIGIISLIDEATGYQKRRENDELKKLFSKFITEELQPWTKKFPLSFFENIKRMYGLEHLKGNPKFAGHLINKYIYNEISHEVLDELKRINPIQESGRRLGCHHQFLTDEIGHPALEKQILKINTLMAASDSKEEFENLFNKTNRNKKDD